MSSTSTYVRDAFWLLNPALCGPLSSDVSLCEGHVSDVVPRIILFHFGLFHVGLNHPADPVHVAFWWSFGLALLAFLWVFLQQPPGYTESLDFDPGSLPHAVPDVHDVSIAALVYIQHSVLNPVLNLSDCQCLGIW